MVDDPQAGFWQRLLRGTTRASGEEDDEVWLLAAACFWQDPRIAARRVRPERELLRPS